MRLGIWQKRIASSLISAIVALFFAGINFKIVKAQNELVYSIQGVYLNDPGFTTNRTDVDKQWALVSSNFIQAWDKSTGIASTIIAVIDTGVDVTHVDLQSINFVPGYDFINNKPIPNYENSDDNGHGTLVAGVIGAVPNNSTGIVGANWQVGIMPLKALDASGNGVSSSVSKSIIWATDHGAHIINLSLGGVGSSSDRVMQDAIDYAFSRGVVIIAAAGNDSAANGVNLDNQPGYPVCADNGENMVIGVGALDSKDQKPPFSNYGVHCVDVSAPGKRILSTINRDPVSGHSAPNSYAYASGTSLAVPYVSAEAALIRALHPTATNKQIRDVILKAVDPVDTSNLSNCEGFSCKGLLGTGKIDAYKAVNEKIQNTDISDSDLVLEEETGVIYFINGGKKQPVSEFVRKQRFAAISLKRVQASQITNIPTGSVAMPSEGTLVKSDKSQTVFYIGKSTKSPVTYQVFNNRGFRYENIKITSENEVSSWLTGKFLAPKEGNLIRGYKNPAIYWVLSDELHPVNLDFYINRGLNLLPILLVPDEDISSFLIGQSYTL